MNLKRKAAMKNWIKRKWRRFLATFHLSDSAVCEESKGRLMWDCFHDYCDATEPENVWPSHFHVYTCRRCGKEFTI